MLRREVVALRREVDRLREAPRTAAAPSKPTPSPRGEEAYRLAIETAESLDQVLQNEVRLWQAIDALRAALRQGQFTDASR